MSAGPSVPHPIFDSVLELLILAGGQYKARQFQYFVRRETFWYRYAEHSPPSY